MKKSLDIKLHDQFHVDHFFNPFDKWVTLTSALDSLVKFLTSNSHIRYEKYIHAN